MRWGPVYTAKQGFNIKNRVRYEISRKVGRPKMAISASAGPRVLRLGTLLLEGVAKQFQQANTCGGARYRIED